MVAVNSDASVRRLKGESRPLQPLSERINALRLLVETVIPFDGDLDKLVLAIKPDILFVGYDHRAPDKIVSFGKGWKSGAKSWICEVIQLPYLKGFSTTASIATHASQ